MAKEPRTAKNYFPAVTRDNVEVMWTELPGHFGGALSKLIVTPENTSTKYFDFRLSTYQPKGFVEEHTHDVEEQIYYILEGEGLMELDGAKKIIHPGLTIFIPPKVKHALYNTGTKDLTFLVVTSPPLKP
jgi:quercetin dioxygenase-like cupin family protein